MCQAHLRVWQKVSTRSLIASSSAHRRGRPMGSKSSLSLSEGPAGTRISFERLFSHLGPPPPLKSDLAMRERSLTAPPCMLAAPRRIHHCVAESRICDTIRCGDRRRPVAISNRVSLRRRPRNAATQHGDLRLVWESEPGGVCALPARGKISPSGACAVGLLGAAS